MVTYQGKKDIGGEPWIKFKRKKRMEKRGKNYKVLQGPERGRWPHSAGGGRRAVRRTIVAGTISLIRDKRSFRKYGGGRH